MKLRDSRTAFWRSRLYKLIYDSFEILNIEDSEIDKESFFSMLFEKGFCFITEVNHKLVNLDGTYFELDVHNKPKSFSTVSHIAEYQLEHKKIDEDGVLIHYFPFSYWNNNLIPLKSIITDYAEQLARIDIDIITNLENCKISKIFIAQDDGQAQQYRKIVDDLSQGIPAIVTNNSSLLNSTTQQIPVFASPSEYLVDKLLQNRLQIINEFYEFVGINSVGGNQIKKERLTEGEATADEDHTDLNGYSLWVEVQKGFDKVNEIYGSDIKIVPAQNDDSPTDYDKYDIITTTDEVEEAEAEAEEEEAKDLPNPDPWPLNEDDGVEEEEKTDEQSEGK